MAALSLEDRKEYTQELGNMEIQAYTDCLEHKYWSQRETLINTILKWIEIALSGLTTVAFFAVVFDSGDLVEKLGASCALILFIVTALMANFKYAESATIHAKTANNLEKISHEYKILITDLDDIPSKEIKSRRDGLKDRYFDEKSACPLMKKLNAAAAISVANDVESHFKLQEQIINIRDKKFAKMMKIDVPEEIKE